MKKTGEKSGVRLSSGIAEKLGEEFSGTRFIPNVKTIKAALERGGDGDEESIDDFRGAAGS